MRRCTCPTTVVAAQDLGGTWTDEDCPDHGREAQDPDEGAVGSELGEGFLG